MDKQVKAYDFGETITAHVFRSGLVKFDRTTPEGALEVARGPEKLVNAVVGVMSRHAYNGVDLICPGVPEAENDDAALDAVIEFEKQITKRMTRYLADPDAAADFISTED